MIALRLYLRVQKNLTTLQNQDLSTYQPGCSILLRLTSRLGKHYSSWKKSIQVDPNDNTALVVSYYITRNSQILSASSLDLRGPRWSLFQQKNRTIGVEWDTGRPNHVNLRLARVMYPHHSISLTLKANTGTPWKVTICSTLHSISASLDVLLAAEFKLLQLERVLINSFTCSTRQKVLLWNDDRHNVRHAPQVGGFVCFFFLSEDEAKKWVKEHKKAEKLLHRWLDSISGWFGLRGEIPCSEMITLDRQLATVYSKLSKSWFNNTALSIKSKHTCWVSTNSITTFESLIL